MQKAPPFPKRGALHYKKSNTTIVVQGSAKNQDFEKIDQSNIGSPLQPGDAAKGQRVTVHCLGSLRDGMSAIIQSVQKVKWYGQEVAVAKVWIQNDALPPHLRRWECPVPGDQNIWLELQSEVEA